MKKVILVFIITTLISCNLKKDNYLNDFKINGDNSLAEDIKIHVDLLFKNKRKEKFLLYENKKIFTPPKDVLSYEFQISYNDSIYAYYGSDNKIKANHKFGKYYFYFFKKENNIYVNIDLISENKKYNPNSIILKKRAIDLIE